MNKNTIAKWVAASIAFTAVAAFTAGVIYELRAIKKLTLDIDDDEEPRAEDLDLGDLIDDEAAEEA